jgi:hypothetical protein
MLSFAIRANRMQRRAASLACLRTCAVLLAMSFALSGVFNSPAHAQQVVDRIIARVEGDVLLLSDLRELGQFQELQGSKVESESTRTEELIDQWIIEQEGKAAQFPQPSEGDVTADLDHLKKDMGGEDAFQKRLQETGLSQAVVRRILRRVLFYSRYLDYKFRTAAQIDPAVEEKYYNTEFAAQMKARGQQLPPLDSVRPAIHELLVQEDISKRAAEWLTESRSRLKVELVSAEAPNAAGTGQPQKQQQN